MKKILGAMGAVIFCLSATAQAGVRLGLMGGYALGLDSKLGQAPAYGLSLSLDLAKSLSVELSGLRYEKTIAGSPEGLSKGRLAVLPVELMVRFRIPISQGPWSASAGFGAGFYVTHFNLEPATVQGWSNIGFALSEALDSTAGLCAALGLEYAVSPTASIGLDVRYHLTKTQGAWSLTDQVGLERVSGKFDSLNLDTLLFGLTVKIVL